MVNYKFISDSVFEANGKNLKELFENAAYALSSFVCQIEQVKPEKAEEFQMRGYDLESTMTSFLGGLITIIATEKKFFSKFEVKEVNDKYVRFKMWGEPIKPELLKNALSSLDYSKYKLEKTKEGYKVIIGLKVLNEI